MYIDNSDNKNKSNFQLHVSFSRRKLFRVIVFIIVLLFLIIMTKSCTNTIKLDKENPYIEYEDSVINIGIDEEYSIKFELINSIDDINIGFYSDCDHIRVLGNKVTGLSEGTCKVYSSYFLNGSFKEDELIVNIK